MIFIYGDKAKTVAKWLSKTRVMIDQWGGCIFHLERSGPVRFALTIQQFLISFFSNGYLKIIVMDCPTGDYKTWLRFTAIPNEPYTPHLTCPWFHFFFRTNNRKETGVITICIYTVEKMLVYSISDEESLKITRLRNDYFKIICKYPSIKHPAFMIQVVCARIW